MVFGTHIVLNNRGTGQTGERSGSVVERQTPKREVMGSKPTPAMLCP